MRQFWIPFTSVALGLTSCAPTVRRYPLREPLSLDANLSSVSVPCHVEATAKEPHHVSCAPTPSYNPLIWDGLDNLLFRPLSESLGVADVGREAVDVNSMDEVPDSSWFTNRIGAKPMTLAELDVGRCSPDTLLDGSKAPDGSWIIDKGKEEGATDGFRVTVPGKGHYLFKADDADEPERGSAAQTVGTRIYHAAGYFVPCEQIVYFRPAVFTLKPGLIWKHNFTPAAPFGQAELEKIFAHSPRRGAFVRMQASAWLPGYNLGGSAFQGMRADDPNDVIPHEDRRELRGKRLLDAWMDRVDDRKGNTLDTWIAATPGAPDGSPGHVIHHSLDTSEALGSLYDFDAVSRRLGYSYIWDWGDIGTDFVGLGTRTSVWETVQKTPGREVFAFMNVRDFVPDKWKNEYPIAAFSRMTEHDGAWMARILARFTPDKVDRLARLSDYSNPEDTAYLVGLLEGRLEKILERYLTVLSPLADLHMEGTSRLCGRNLAEWRSLRDATAFRYTANVVGRGWAEVVRRPAGEVCVVLPHVAPDGGPADDDASRYVGVRVDDGVAKGPLLAFLYDLGPTRGYRLAGIERPPGKIRGN